MKLFSKAESIALPLSLPVPQDPRSLENYLLDRMWGRLNEPTRDNEIAPSVKNQLIEEIRRLQSHPDLSYLTPDLEEKITEKILDQLTGFGPLETFLKDTSVTEIMVNGWDQVFVERKGQIEKSLTSFLNDVHYRSVIERMVSPSGRRVDVASPMCDVRLKEGYRLNVVLPPLSLNGPVLTIRKFQPNIIEFNDLVREKTLTLNQAEILLDAVRERKNILISGNTGSGKTTFLNILSRFIDESERILTLEDAAELKLQQPHVVRLETRKKNIEGEGEISMADLVVNALRMRPDRLIIGECRGPEVLPMLQAFNTGHKGSMTTLHANSAREAVDRLELMVLCEAQSWPIHVIRRQIATGIDLIVHLQRRGGIRELVEMVGLEWKDGDIRCSPWGQKL